MGQGQSDQSNLTELLQNPSELSSWTISKKGGDGWTVEADEEFQRCFASSHDWCVKSQKIDLKALGYTDAFLDSVPGIMVSDYYRGRPDCASVYKIRVQLLDRASRLMDEFVQEEKTVTRWIPVSKLFQGYGKGLRFILFEHSGKDSKGWKGHYGAKVAASSVVFCLPGIGTPVVKSVHPTGVTKYTNKNVKTAIKYIIGFWNLGMIDSEMQRGTIVSGTNREFRQYARDRGFESLPNGMNVTSTRIDLQWISNGRAGIAVQIGNVTFAQVNIPIDQNFGVRHIRHLLLCSMEAGEVVEIAPNDGRIQLPEDEGYFSQRNIQIGLTVIAFVAFIASQGRINVIRAFPK